MEIKTKYKLVMRIYLTNWQVLFLPNVTLNAQVIQLLKKMKEKWMDSKVTIPQRQLSSIQGLKDLSLSFDDELDNRTVFAQALVIKAR